MSPDQLLEELSIQMSAPPLSEALGGDAVPDLADPLIVAMLILALETELMMSGIITFLGNSSGRFAAQTVTALQMVGCSRQATLLQQILDIATAAGMTHEAIQQDRSGLKMFAVTTFSELHGDKWDLATNQIAELEPQIDSQQLIAATEAFVGRHIDRFQKALGH